MRMSSSSMMFGGANSLDTMVAALQAKTQQTVDKVNSASSFSAALASLQAAEETTETTETKSTADMTMEEYKTYIYDKISTLPVHPTQINRSASVFISEEGFAAMKENPEYEEWVLGKLQEDFMVCNPLCQKYGSYVVYQFGAKKSDYRGDSWYAEFQGGQGKSIYKKRSEGSFWNNHTQRAKQRAKENEEYYAQKRMLQKMGEQLAAMRSARAKLAGQIHTSSDMPIFGVPAEYLLAGLGGGMTGDGL